MYQRRIDEEVYRLNMADSAAPVFWWNNEWWSHCAFRQLIDQCAVQLERGGLRAGGRIALLLPNSPVFLALCMAAWRLGATVVPVNGMAGREAILEILEHAEASALFLPETREGRGCGEGIAPDARIPVNYVDLEGHTEECRIGSRGTANDGDVAVIFFTSGTSGTPKAVRITHENLIDNARSAVSHVEGLRPGETMVNALPNFHALGFSTCGVLPLLSEMRQVLLPTFMPAEKTLSAMRAADATVMVAVPTMISLLLGAVGRAGEGPETLRLLVSGGDRMPVALDARCRELLGIGVLEGYGLTETSPVVSVNRSYTDRKLGTVGPLLPGYDYRVLDEDGREVLCGEPGVLHLKGPLVAGGYFKNPELDAKQFRDSWFVTDDIVTMDEDGYLSIVDRASDLIIVGGFNVYPRDVERVLDSHAAVETSAVVGMPHSVSGQIVQAFVKGRPGREASERELIAYCRSRLAHYKVPRRVRWVDEFPRSSVGKILKHQLLERA